MENTVQNRSFSVLSTSAIAIVAVIVMAGHDMVLGQQRGGAPQGGRGAAPADPNLPTEPTAVALPSFEMVTGPGAMYDSSPAQWPERDMAHYSYRAAEYFVAGTAAGKPYTTRLVIRRPTDDAALSGLAVAEAMHPIGAAHAFEYNSVYIMDSGHVAVEIATAGTQNFSRFNEARYVRINVENDQANEILAQVGALVRSSQGPLAGAAPRNMVLWGTSASSGILTRYLPGHAVYRTPDMQHIYNGFMPTSNGSNIQPVDVPMIQVPTQHEYSRVATAQQDGDEPGTQFRVYEFAGLGHLDSRNNVRFQPGACEHPLSSFPLEAYMSVALHHLLQWVDSGVAPPNADRALLDRNVRNDGSLMVLDEHGNVVGGIRNPYIDFPIAKYTERNSQTPNATGFNLCGLSVYTTPIPASELRAMYGSTASYVQQFEARLNELEAAGWSLPVYHDLLVEDAKAVRF
jgi:hypothetical protein